MSERSGIRTLNVGGVSFEPLEGRQLLSGTGRVHHASHHHHHTASTPTVTKPVLSVGPNVDVTQAGGNEMEGQVSINPANPSNMAMVAQNDVNGGTTINFSYSYNGGASWGITQLGSAQDGYPSNTPRADARLIFDGFGNLYVVYMVSPAKGRTDIVSLHSSNGGASFDSVTVPVSGLRYNPDSPWLATGPDASSGGRQRVWMSFTDFTSRHVMVVGLSSSRLGPSSWLTPRAVSDTYGTYSSLAVGPAGQLAIAWQKNEYGQGPTQLLYDVDPSGTGAGFGRDQVLTTTNVGGYDYIPAQNNRSIDAEIKLAFDRSGGATNGRLYAAYTTENGDESNDTDIVLQYTDDLGNSWSQPTRVNDDATRNSQFNPTLAVDQTTGVVGLSWLDARNSPDNTGAELFATVSLDHGVTFQRNVQVSTGMSNQQWKGYSSNNLDYGDNSGMAFYAGKLVPVWSDNSASHSTLDVYADVITITA